MEDIFDLATSKKVHDFVKFGLSQEFEISISLAEVASDFPYIGSLIKLGIIGNKLLELHFVKKLARFLEKEQGVSTGDKDKFINGLSQSDRTKLYKYITHYLLRAEDDEKADIMGYIYKTRVNGEIDNELFLRLCSIVDRAFVEDLRELPQYTDMNKEYSTAANNFINLGLIDNFTGGVVFGGVGYKLNKIGHSLYNILKENEWYG